MKPGVYYDLPEEEYHAAPALSASGLRWLMVSAPDFWARSWMNPEPLDDGTKSAAMVNGTAMHKRILEGLEAFEAAYAPEIDPDDYPNALRTADDLKRELKACELKVSGKKEDLINRLKTESSLEYQIWDDLVAGHAEKHAGKTLLPANQIHDIQIAAAHIEKHPQLSKAFTGGKPEVSIFWQDPTWDIPCKARIDYLKPQAIVDFKTVGNPQGIPVDRLLYSAIARHRYHVQAVWYSRAVSAACFNGWIEGGNERTWLFVMQTNPVPVTRGIILPRGSVWDIAEAQIEAAVATFKNCMETFGQDTQWVDLHGIIEAEDTAFPAWIGMDG